MASWFESVSSPESISAIATAVATIIGAITAFIYKCKGKSTKEVLESLVKEEGKTLQKVVETQSKVIADCLKKKESPDKNKKADH